MGQPRQNQKSWEGNAAVQFGRLRRANPPQTRPIECRTLPQSAAQNTFRILFFPLLSFLFVEQICDLLSLPTVVVHGPSLAGNPAAIRHCPTSAIPQSLLHWIQTRGPLYGVPAKSVSNNQIIKYLNNIQPKYLNTTSVFKYITSAHFLQILVWILGM